MLTDSAWLEVFPMAKLYNLEGSPSDHSVIFLEPKKKVVEHTRKFRFENAWMLDPLCYQIVKDSWELNSSDHIMQRIQQCGERLESWGKNLTRDFSKRIKNCKIELQQLRNRRDEQSVLRYKEVKHQLFLILDQREVFWRQRSKQLWLQAGDKNTKYFHASASTRRRSN